jgi:hypothetical protein
LTLLRRRCERYGQSVKRPTGVTIIAVLTFCGAAILALGSFGFFFVAVMGMSGGDAGQPTSVAIAGMGIAGGCSLLILATVTVCLAIGVLKLREWAWIVSIASNAVGIGCTILSLFAIKEYRVLPPVPSIVFHLLVVSTGVWILAYLLLPRIKRAFSARPRNWLIVEFLVATYGHVPTASNLWKRVSGESHTR